MPDKHFMETIEDFMKIFKNNSQNLSAAHAFILHTANLTGNSSSNTNEHNESGDIIRNVLLVLAYGTLTFISLFGNSIVCYVIIRNKRMYTVTNFFIANMAMSDLLLTCFNVPFNIARNLMTEWPFGDFLCHFVNLSLMVSVYVSTFTLTSIALDRQRVILYPLKPRITKPVGLGILAVIWIVAILFSLPYGIYNKVQSVNWLTKNVRRCRQSFPEPAELFEQCLTLITIILQYIIPLTIIAVSYGRIVKKLWLRSSLGAVTQQQQVLHARAKRKSIKLLITVVVVFGLCWMPINLYHLLTDFHPNAAIFHYDSTTFFILHWIAISSTCYNPFVYCWLNETFRAEVKSCFACCKRHRRVHPGVEIDGILLRSDKLNSYRSKTFTSMVRSTSNFSSIKIHKIDKSEREQAFLARDSTHLIERDTSPAAPMIKTDDNQNSTLQ
ncbi:G protein-coupled receptor 83 [Mytilus galloprovincialis]|uniref:G protein-coupled receptor 83 n=1 Tax=Mytilus galloprovincialis TaxID=29158 RepID=A0A8B6DSP7_MYTGA|nr:G protein-coupled receptor 83 [Mytilus galloprovincialis]